MRVSVIYIVNKTETMLPRYLIGCTARDGHVVGGLKKINGFGSSV